MGVEWEAMSCSPVSGIDILDPFCDQNIIRLFTEGGADEVGEAAAFTVESYYKCGAVGSGGLDAGKERATARLAAREEQQAEFHVWARLADSATDINPAGALDPAEALAALEDWLGAEYGSLGVIHGTRGAASILDTRLVTSGSRLTTRLGTPVVAGGGYPGSSPAGADAAAGETWVYASPALFGYRGPVESSSNRPGDLLDRGKNDLYAIAARDYVVGFDPCGVAAVRLNKTCC
jgi:hypothetical protein